MTEIGDFCLNLVWCRLTLVQRFAQTLNYTVIEIKL